MEAWWGDLQFRLQQLRESCDALESAVSAMPEMPHTNKANPGLAVGKTVFHEVPNKGSFDTPAASKFTISSGVPTLISPPLTKVPGSSNGRSELRTLDALAQQFIVSEPEALKVYDALHATRRGGRKSLKEEIQSLSLLSARHAGASFTEEDEGWLGRVCSCLPALHPVSNVRMRWDAMSLVIVMADVIIIPVSVAWPSGVRIFSVTFFYQLLCILFWLFDMALSFVSGIYIEGELCMSRRLIALRYLKGWFALDVLAVAIDAFLITGDDQIPQEIRAIRLLRLLRLAKFQTISAAFEDRCVKAGKQYLIYMKIFGTIVFSILATIHVFACLLVYIGSLTRQANMPNWLDTYGMVDLDNGFQYMRAANWVLSNCSPVPYPFIAQNPVEQLFMLLVIFYTLPLIGSQLGRLTGTVTLMNEKRRERDQIKRDFQRYLLATKVDTELAHRMQYSLDGILKNPQINEPVATKLLPLSLVTELHVSRKRAVIERHPFISLLMHREVNLAGAISAAFQIRQVAAGEEIFEGGKKAEHMYLTTEGTYMLLCADALDNNHNKITEPAWFSELSLFSYVWHVSTLVSYDVGKIYSIGTDDFMAAIKDSPPAVVFVYEYAQYLMRMVAKEPNSSTDLLPEHWSNQACDSTQLGDLLMGGDRRRSSIRQSISLSGEEERILDWVDELGSEHQLDDALADRLRGSFVELDWRDGVYARRSQVDEGERCLLAMLSAIWLSTDNHESLIASQKPEDRLSASSWSSLQEFNRWADLTPAQLKAVLVFLSIRGIGKIQSIARKCAPSSRQSPEKIILYVMRHLESEIPSIEQLDGEGTQIVMSILEILHKFNFGQFLQGENNPHSIKLLQEAIESEGIQVFKACLFAQVCILSGLTGAVSLKGSLFLNERNASSLIQGLKCLQLVTQAEPQRIYWNYISDRAATLNLTIALPSHLAVARLLCLTRTVDQKGLVEVQKAWNDLNEHEVEVLEEFLLVDGIQSQSFIMAFLPQFLANARANLALGLKSGFVILADFLERLHANRCFVKAESLTVKVDMSSLASLLVEVDSLWLARACLENGHIVKHAKGVSFLMTLRCYQLINGQVVHYSRWEHILERLSENQLKLLSSRAPPEDTSTSRWLSV
eukprot:TRINITY_DN32770_c0_g1_i1.p1 TRINITY_DN32770_c0_g1~~TRINITY_DN32770_c0_g1_i1.p1  ORF type:complete len:1180 (-),score=179.07 TRINITY_DN32770_c0_g1_i1:235-3612(-)